MHLRLIQNVIKYLLQSYTVILQIYIHFHFKLFNSLYYIPVYIYSSYFLHTMLYLTLFMTTSLKNCSNLIASHCQHHILFGFCIIMSVSPGRVTSSSSFSPRRSKNNVIDWQLSGRAMSQMTVGRRFDSPLFKFNLSSTFKLVEYLI